MTPLRAIFEGRKAFIPFVVAGDPDLATTLDILRALAGAGADAIEVGVPFSDPIADGPTIQRAADRAIARGASVESVLEMLRKFRAEAGTPVILFTYLNPLLAYRARRPDATELSVACDGVLAVDLPIEEAEEHHADLVPPQLDRIFLAAPTTSEARLRRIAAAGGPFVYFVSRYGVTGARTDIPEGLAENVARVREIVRVPVAVGFGVSTAAQAAAVAEVAEGVVVGSAIVDRIERAGVRAVEAVRAFATELASAVHRG